MPTRLGSQRGSFLVQALLLVVLLGYASASLLRLTLGRYAAVHSGHSAERDRQLLRSAEVLVRACLDRSAFARSSCGLGAAAPCLPRAVEGRTLSVRASGTPPLCALELSLAEGAPGGLLRP